MGQRSVVQLSARAAHKGQAHRTRRATSALLRGRSSPAGSMGLKVDAACRLVELTGHVAAIGAITEIEAILDVKAGTVTAPSDTYMPVAGSRG